MVRHEGFPKLIQGGMGVGVSDWKLARAVSQLGQLGVVSGTALDTVFARRLQLGDPGGHMRRAIAQFPYPAIATRVLDRYYIEGGKEATTPFKSPTMFRIRTQPQLEELTVLANFVEVFLAKEGHAGKVGLNLMEKVQLPTLPSLYGAMLAGVDAVLMGAGIPRHIPGMLDRLANGERAELPITVQGNGEPVVKVFDPSSFLSAIAPHLKRPLFLAIVSSATLASMLVTKSNGRVDGFVIEAATAGGHNAPPRGPKVLSERGEPVYGVRDEVNLEEFRALGLPFYLAGSRGTAEKLHNALEEGAAGVQVGTAFALSDESGLTPEIKHAALEKLLTTDLEVFTDPQASPTGFPFKVVQLEGTIASPELYSARERICDLGYLRTPFYTSDGRIEYRCPAEPVEDYVRKGGDRSETAGRKCVCNGLVASIGLGQYREGQEIEKPLLTLGDDVESIKEYVPPEHTSYSVKHVVAGLVLPHEESILSIEE